MYVITLVVLMICGSLSLSKQNERIKRPLIGTIGDLLNFTYVLPLGSKLHKRIKSKNPATQFMGLRFSQFDLPPGDSLEIFSESNSFTYTNHGPEGSYTDHVHGKVLNLRYIPSKKPNISKHHYRGVTITNILEGYATSTGREDVCGVKPQWWPTVCNATKYPEAYSNSKSIARLTMDGIKYGTGFLVGCNGYFLTNNHNVNSASSASTLKFEFGAESSTCTDPCNSVPLGCPGSVVVTGAKLIATDEKLDYSLLQLSRAHQKMIKSFGYLNVRKKGPVLHEPIYVVHHPDGYPKTFTNQLENGTETIVTSLNVENECGKEQVGYMADTRGGSSGSPIISRRDHKVLALHHCGGCENVAYAMPKILKDLKTRGFRVPSCFYRAKAPESSCSILQPHVEYVGYDVKGVSAANSNQCCDLCKKHKHCRAFTWTKQHGGTCWFKSRRGLAVHALGAVSAALLKS